MTFAILFAFVAFALAVDWQLERRKNSRRILAGQMPVHGSPTLAGLPVHERAAVLRAVLPGRAAKEVLHHPGHAWARGSSDDILTIGADEITGKLLGAIDCLELPPAGAQLWQGRAAWKLSRESRSIEQLSPLSGEVVEVNHEAVKHPEIVNRSPYRRGWLLKVRPTNLADDLSNLFAGNLADAWLALSRSRINAALSTQDSSLLATAQDGGELVEGLGDLMTEAQWKEISVQLFEGV
jgi:glycine cleavage system H lipoate-binding protein